MNAFTQNLILYRKEAYFAVWELFRNTNSCDELQ